MSCLDGQSKTISEGKEGSNWGWRRDRAAGGLRLAWALMRNSWIGFNSKFRLCNVGHVYVMTKYYWTLTGGRIFKWFRISWELSDLGEVGRLPFCKRGSRHPEHETSAPSCLPYRPTHYSTNFFLRICQLWSRIIVETRTLRSGAGLSSISFPQKKPALTGPYCTKFPF